MYVCMYVCMYIYICICKPSILLKCTLMCIFIVCATVRVYVNCCKNKQAKLEKGQECAYAR